MINLLTTLLAFAVAVGVLIAIHEYGHFLVARLSGVKVLRYSIGFGKPLWRWHGRGADRTEYVIAAIPLGGYVKMLDEREGEVAEEDRPRAFNRQPVSKRFAIVAAGPMFNFLFAIAAYWVMFIVGVPGLKPIIGEVRSDSVAAEAGLREGQLIVAVDGELTPTWSAAFDRMLPAALREQPVELTVRENDHEFTRVLRLDRLDRDLAPQELVTAMGLQPFRPPVPPTIGEIAAGSPAERAGLRTGDRVVAIDGEPVERWEALVTRVQESPGRAMRWQVVRDGNRFEVQVTPRAVDTERGPVGQVGAGVDIDPRAFEGYVAELRHGPLAAVPQAVAKTWEMSTLTLEMLGQMITGRASIEHLSGPITIATYAKASAVAGITQFLSFLALVSVSLGVLNLLPIPILDGGHLMYYVAEIIKGRPVSERTQLIGQKIGIILILMLMTLALYNDMMRLVQ